MSFLRFRALATLLVVMGFASAAFGSSESSSGTRGGGDPDALEALQILENIAAYLKRSFVLENSDQADLASLKVQEFKALMNDERRTPITLTSEILRDDSGAEKFALFTQDPPKILINRASWRASDLAFKSQLLTLELLGLIGLPNRYAVSARVDLDLLRKTSEILKSGWDFVSISQDSGVVTIERPYSVLKGEGARPRPFVIARNEKSQQMLNVICNMLGFTEAFHGDVTELRPTDAGNATLFDSLGSFKAVVAVKANDPQYQVLRTLYCNR